MILLAYILVGHPDWDEADIRIYAAFPKEDVEEQHARLRGMITTGRLPISEKNLEVIGTDEEVDFDRLVGLRSGGADLVIVGFTEERLRQKGPRLFQRHSTLRDVLWVAAEQQVLIE
jgi:hypothetical protein